MGVAPMWKRTSILSGVAEAVRDSAPASDTGWADFGDGGGSPTGNLISLPDIAPAPAANLMDMLGGEWTDKEYAAPTYSLSFGVVETPGANLSTHSKAAGGSDLLFGGDDGFATAAEPNYSVASRITVCPVTTSFAHACVRQFRQYAGP
jgi:hypothetical protein